MKTMDEWQGEVHALAVTKGWWEGETRRTSEILMNVAAEVSEAWEAYRNNLPLVVPPPWHNGKPEGIAVELADTVIRIMDWFQSEGLSLEDTIRLKHEYNKTRPYRHGGKRA